MIELFKSGSIALFSSLFCIWLLTPVANKIGLVDAPGGRKQHQASTPLIGGIAMFFGFCLALLSLHIQMIAYRGLFAGSALIVLMGVVDDFKELGSRLRLIGQFFASAILISWGHHIVNNMGDLFFMGNVHLGMWAYPITLISVVGFINAMNMLDGQDGLAGSVAFGQVILLMLCSYELMNTSQFNLMMMLAIVLLVFLFFNLQMPWRKQAVIFMGDSGSTFLAFVVAWFATSISQANIHYLKPITVMWILAFPLFDLISVMIHRIRRGRSPLSASRDHFHHVLHMRGLDVRVSSLVLFILSFSMGAGGVAMNILGVEEGYQTLMFVLVLILYLAMVRFVRRPINAEFLEKTSRQY